jgi:hypothetical protein
MANESMIRSRKDEASRTSIAEGAAAASQAETVSAPDSFASVRWLRGCAAALATLLAVAPIVRSQVPVQAVTSGDTTAGDAAALKCLEDTQGTLTAKDPKVDLDSTTTLTWAATVPSSCPNVVLYIGSQVVGRTGTLTVRPMANTRYTLRARSGNARDAEIASVVVSVTLPKVVTITPSSSRATLVQALGTAGTTVIVTNDVNLDLSYMHEIGIADNVVFQGGRTPRVPGPRLFSTVRASTLFTIYGDNVRITGLRIEGPEMGVSDADDNSRAILTDSSVNVEIDHNEISGWSTAGIMVWDTKGRIDPAVNPQALRIHDNFIHHNQHEGGEGYGVAVQYGAYASIAHNVFDWNRHAIEGDGRPGSGYEANGNLVLKNGGLHRWIPFPGFWVHTHQFDMHGSDNCGIWDLFSDSLWNCGAAGQVMYIRNNTFLYTEGPDIKLRGTPSDGMYVGANVFAYPYLVDTYLGTSGASEFVRGAVQQNERGLVIEPGNVTGYDGSARLGSCDFDGDGINDLFMATGATWWYSSGGQGPWTYLNTSSKRLSEVRLGYFDGDNRCDVSVGGIVYSGGMPNTPAVLTIGTSSVLAH